jgi:hypothetical protein
MSLSPVEVFIVVIIAIFSSSLTVIPFLVFGFFWGSNPNPSSSSAEEKWANKYTVCLRCDNKSFGELFCFNCWTFHTDECRQILHNMLERMEHLND